VEDTVYKEYLDHFYHWHRKNYHRLPEILANDELFGFEDGEAFPIGSLMMDMICSDDYPDPYGLIGE
jgi:hypothetical protein